MSLSFNAKDNLDRLKAQNVLAGLMGTAGKQPVYIVDPAIPDSKIDDKDFEVPTSSEMNFIPVWHGTVEYGPSFVRNSIEKLQLATCQDLARYLKVVGFKKAHVTKLMAAQLITACILAAKRDNKFNSEVNGAIMCGGMTDRWYNRMPGTVCEDTRRLKEILCCLEIAYTELKKTMDAKYARIEEANRPVFGLSLKSDCPPTQFLARNSDGEALGCVDIPPLMIAVFEQEAASIEAGQRVSKEAFTGMIYDGAKQDEALWHFENMGTLQRETFTLLADALKKGVFSQRGIGLRFSGGTAGENAAIRTIKQLSRGVMEHGKLVFGPVRQALGFISDKTSDDGEIIVTPLTCESDRLALWIVSQLEIFFDVSSLIKRSICEKKYDTRYVWNNVRKENHALIKAILLDIIETINPSKTADLAEAITMLTIFVQSAVDKAAEKLILDTTFQMSWEKVRDWCEDAPTSSPTVRGYKLETVENRLGAQSRLPGRK